MVFGLAAVVAAVVAIEVMSTRPPAGDGYAMAARSQMTWHQAATDAAIAGGIASGQVPPAAVTPPRFYVGVEPWVTLVVNGATVTMQPGGSGRTPLLLADALVEASDGDYGAGMVRGGWFWSATQGQMFAVPGVTGPFAAYATVLQ